MNGKTTNVIGVGLELSNLLASREVVDAQLEVVGAGDELNVSLELQQASPRPTQFLRAMYLTQRTGTSVTSNVLMSV